MAPSTIAAAGTAPSRPLRVSQGKTSAESVANRPLLPISCFAVRKLSGAARLAAVTAALALVVPGGISAAQTIAPKPNLTTLVAEAQQFLSQASAIAELDQSSGVKVSTLSNQVSQALRDKQTADQQIVAVNALEAQMNAKKKIIN